SWGTGPTRRVSMAGTAQRRASTSFRSARSRRPAACTVYWSGSSTTTTKRRRAGTAGPATTCSRSWRAAWTTSCSGPGSPRAATWPAKLVTHGHLTVNGRKVDIPSYRVAENDIVEVRQKSRDMTPFVVAQAEAGERQVPAWLEVVPDQMRVLVHALPVRAQIDTQVQEQLIVELYSK